MEDTGVVLSPEASLKIATPQPTRTTSAQAVNRSILLRRRCCILLAASRFFRRLSISSRSSATAVTPFVSCFCYYNGFSGIKQVSNFEFFFKSAIFPPNLPPRGRGGRGVPRKRAVCSLCAFLVTALARCAPPQSGLRPASSPGGEALSFTISLVCSAFFRIAAFKSSRESNFCSGRRKSRNSRVIFLPYKSPS